MITEDVQGRTDRGRSLVDQVQQATNTCIYNLKKSIRPNKVETFYKPFSKSRSSILRKQLNDTTVNQVENIFSNQLNNGKVSSLNVGSDGS